MTEEEELRVLHSVCILKDYIFQRPQRSYVVLPNCAKIMQQTIKHHTAEDFSEAAEYEATVIHFTC